MNQRELIGSRSGLVTGHARYDAFLSYSHAVDGRLAPAVQQGLHRLAKPWYRIRALRVFRDQLSLSANPDLWATITAALGDSRFFILMASPGAAASPWVRREVEFWQEHRGQRTFLIVLTEGNIAWDHVTEDFDWTSTTALPTSLKGWFDSEPLWVSLGWAHRDTQLSVRHGRFRDSIATLAAPLHGIAKDDLDSEDVRQHRRTTRVRNGVIAGLTLLTVLSVILGLVAREQTNRAESALQQAISRELTSRSQTIGDTDPAISTLLSVAAWRLNPTPDARAGMLVAFNRPGIADLPFGGGPVAFSPDRRTMATGGAGSVQLWDAVSHQPIGASLAGHNGFVGRLAFSPDGALLATGSSDGTVRLWSVNNQSQIGDPLIQGAGTILAVTFSPDGASLATGSSDGTVRLWDVASSRQIGDAFLGYAGGTVNISPDGHLLAFFDQDRTVKLWDIATRTQIGASLAGFIGDIAAIAFSPDSATVATGGADGAVRLWDVPSSTLIGDPLIGFTGGIEGLGVKAVAFSADGSTVTAAGLDGTVRSWDVTSHAQIGDALTQGSGILWASFSFDGDTLATSSQSGNVRLWDLTSRHHRSTSFANVGGNGYSAVLSPDGGTMAVGGDNGTVSLWDFASHTQIGTSLVDPDSAAITSMVFSPAGDRLAVGGHSSKVMLWDLETHSPVGDSFTGFGEPIAFSRDGNLLVTNDSISEGIQVWDVASHARIAQFRPDSADGTAHFASATVSHDGRVLATGSYDGKVQIWDLNSGQQIGDPLTGVVEQISSVAFSPDQLSLAVGTASGTVRLWNLPSRAPIGDQLPGFTGARVLSLAFSPDGVTLAAGAENGTARLWDVNSHIPIGLTLGRYGETVQSIAFSPDSRSLATSTGTADPAVRLWNVPSLTQVDAVLCARLGRSMTPDEWSLFVQELPYRSVC